MQLDSALLRFEPVADPEGKRVRDSLSAVAILDAGETLFLATDETIGQAPSIERLRRIDENSYGSHERLALTDFVDLPDPKLRGDRVSEVDLEGLASSEGYLWFVGSYSSRRRKPSSEGEAGLRELEQIVNGRNRAVLGRIPLVPSAGGTKLTKRDGGRRAALLRSDLRKVLRDDPLLGPFLRTFPNSRGKKVILPGKDNGFDIEGLAAIPGPPGHTRVFLGLRGPVLRGFAIVLELGLCQGSKPSRLELALFPEGKLYRRHAVNLAGLGIRDLCVKENDLWILAGPTMTLEAPVALFCWKDFLSRNGDSLTRSENSEVTEVTTLPAQFGSDNAEGLALVEPSPAGSEGDFMVVYDAPAKERCPGECSVLATWIRR